MTGLVMKVENDELEESFINIADTEVLFLQLRFGYVSKLPQATQEVLHEQIRSWSVACEQPDSISLCVENALAE